MQTLTLNLENELIELNVQTTEQLFELYNSLHFIYPAKMGLLNPVLNTVKRNWDKALTLNFPLFCASTVAQNRNNIIATGGLWQYLDKGVIGQHLASNHPVGSRIIFLGMIDKIIEGQNTFPINSFQVYYRPQNKYSGRAFEPVSLKVGKELSAVIPYNYFEVPFLKHNGSNSIEITEITTSNDRDFIDFLSMQKGEVFIKAQELDTDDINLITLNNRFKRYGLKRTRRIFAARHCNNNSIYGVIIINQSSLGFNFSFFENSSELILNKNADPARLLQAAQSLLYKASELNLLSPLQWLPVLTEPAHTEIIEKLGGKLTRSYNLFMLLKGGYETWYEHTDQLTNAVFQRFITNTYEKDKRY
jgi:hypothetical protein